jgi:hypothetical protein
MYVTPVIADAKRQKYVPWRYIASWRCLFRGRCCQRFRILLRTREYAEITDTYGLEVVDIEPPGKAYLKKIGGKCIFQHESHGLSICLLQRVHMKTYACKMWPFLVKSKPRRGEAVWEAEFIHEGKVYHIYVNTHCLGLNFGESTSRFVKEVLSKAVEPSLNPDREPGCLTSIRPQNPIRI